MSKQDWVILYRRSSRSKGCPRYYFDLTFDELYIKLYAKGYIFDSEDATYYHYVSTRQSGFSASIIKRGDATIGKVKRKAIIRNY